MGKLKATLLFGPILNKEKDKLFSHIPKWKMGKVIKDGGSVKTVSVQALMLLGPESINQLNVFCPLVVSFCIILVFC